MYRQHHHPNHPHSHHYQRHLRSQVVEVEAPTNLPSPRVMDDNEQHEEGRTDGFHSFTADGVGHHNRHWPPHANAPPPWWSWYTNSSAAVQLRYPYNYPYNHPYNHHYTHPYNNPYNNPHQHCWPPAPPPCYMMQQPPLLSGCHEPLVFPPTIYRSNLPCLVLPY